MYSLTTGLASAALPPCVKVDDCSCKTITDSGEQAINIRRLGSQDEAEAPRFGFKQYNPAEPWEYAYNPCYPWSDGTTNCKDVVVCQRSVYHPDQTFGLGDASANWTDDGTHYYIVHTHTTRTTYIKLRCDASAKTPKFDYYKDQSSEYTFTLTTECACPGTCHSLPPTAPPPTGSMPSTLSIGSILCVVASVLLLVYAVGGVLFMKCVRHAEGMEVVPNIDIWTSLFRNIRDGCVFVFSCGKRSGYGASYTRAVEQDPNNSNTL
ncbi:uncharacterized protein LOC110973212 isoform X2 [Acanthaster planci]|uniref:Uncharacterized protein LOC110973212 isoform X2 n=1 Tax=Acanthaster planci TaxID=133434 RepID=A0A8B7XFL1_ACAPL|nr:uncharacterized protein LOC110973212 isoform X2 [Acanthaster planci]